MRSRSALIIDDEPDVASFLASVLSEHGWKVRTARGGDKGLALAREELPSVILLDLFMPGERGGLSTFMALRRDAVLKAVPVVFVTAVPEPTSRDAPFYFVPDSIFRPDAYLEKPVDPDHLLATLDRIVGAVSQLDRS